MKRVSALLVMSTLVLSWGCGMKSYEERLKYTLGEMQYRKHLDKFLSPAPVDPKFKDFPLYIRAPHDMPASTQFLMYNEADLPPGQFDLATSFASQGQGNLHVLARRKAAKKAPPKNAPPPAEPPAAQRDFVAEVLAILSAVYPNVDVLQAAAGNPKALETVNKKTNQYKRLIFDSSNGNKVQVYFYKSGPYDVALIWDTPAAVDKTAVTSRDLTLQSFAVGNRAGNYFKGSMAEGDSGGGEGGAPGEGGAENATVF